MKTSRRNLIKLGLPVVVTLVASKARAVGSWHSSRDHRYDVLHGATLQEQDPSQHYLVPGSYEWREARRKANSDGEGER